MRKVSCTVCGDQGGPPRSDGLASFCTSCGAARALRVGDRVALPKAKLVVRPAFTGAGKPSHRPARKPGKFGA